MWECPRNPAPRRPWDACDEGLGIKHVQGPVKHLTKQSNENNLHTELVNGLKGASEEVIIAATDGSAIEQHSAAGWAIAYVSSGSTEKTAGLMAGADQSSYAAELEAIRRLVKANKEAKRTIHVLIDNKSVVDGQQSIMKAINDKTREQSVPLYESAWCGFAVRVDERPHYRVLLISGCKK